MTLAHPRIAQEPLFNAYLMVDWSASSRPKRGKDSIWYCLLERGQEPVVENPATRHEAIAEVETILVRLVDEKKSVLVGFDFPYAYPRGLAHALDLDTVPQQPWRAVWREWGSLIKDQPDNGNNRFDVAAQLNERLSSGPGPFWGCPSRRAGACLSSKKAPCSFDERRLTEHHARTTQPAWKLRCGVGR